MAFTQSGSEITQTGTDTNLSGLAGLAGVTVTNRQSHIEYDIGSNRIRINGDLTIAAAGTREQFTFRGDAGHDFVDIQINSGGSLTLGTFQANPLDYEFQNFVPAIQENINPDSLAFGVTNGFLQDGAGQPGRRASLWVRSGATFRSYARTWNVASFGTGLTSTVDIQSSRFTFHASAYMYGPNVTIIDSVYDTFSFVSPTGYVNISNNTLTRGGLFNISNSTPIDAVYTVSNVRDLNGINLIDSGTVGAGNVASDSIAINLETGSDQTYSVGTGGREWNVFLRREIGFNTLDANGNILPSSKVFYQGAVGTETTITTDGQGRHEFDFEFATRRALNSAVLPYTFFTKNGDTTDDLIDVRAIEYNSSILINSDVSLRGLNRLELNLSLLPDFSITESDPTVVAAYTDIESAFQLYDRSKLFLVDNYEGEQETITLRSGDTLNARDYDVVIDSNAPDVFDFDGSTITIRASVLAGNITTTGTVTLLNGADVQGSITDQNGTQTFIRFTNLLDNSEVRIFREADGVEIGMGVENSSGGVVDIDYTHTADISAYAVVFSLNTIAIRLNNITLTEASQIIPINQQTDRQYENI